MAGKNITDLNDHCLIEALKFLDNVDLMTLSLTTKRFRQLVLNYVIPQIMYDLNGAACQMFGKQATKISYNLYRSPLEEFLDAVSYYCTPGRLTNVEVWYGLKNGKRQIDQDLLDRSAKYFENVKNLSCFLVDQFNEWLTSIPSDKIRTLSLHMMGTYEFSLNPESYPNLLDCTILIDSLDRMETYARHRERYDAVTEFIKRKSKIQKLSYRDHDFHEQMIFRTVAENCLRITSLGVLKIKNDGLADDWYFLKKCQHLQDVTIQISIFNQRKFADIFHVFCDMRKLKILHINFDRDKKEIAKEIILDEIASFLKSNNGYRKADTLQYMELGVDIDIDDDVLQQICTMIASVFRVTTLHLAINQHPLATNPKYVSAIVHNLHGLEHLAIGEDCFSESLHMEPIAAIWSTLMELVNCYDPQIIAIASCSNFVYNDPKQWHWY